MELTSLFYSVALRSAQLLVEASSTIICGLLIAGILRMMVGTVGIRRVFGGRGWKGYLRAAIIGTLLPVCSIGVIPVARELRRAGVQVGTIFAFVLAAPLLNPISFLYGLTLAEPFVIMCFFAAKLILAVSAGELWEWLLPTKPVDTSGVDGEPMPAPGLKRLVAVVIHACREAIGPTLLYCVVAVLSSGLLAALIPFGSLQTTMSHNHQAWTSPLLMAAIAFPAYTTPLGGMMKLGLMFEHGNSIGAAFVLFVLGAGVNVGLVWWVGREFGWKRASIWFGALIVTVILLGYVAEHTLYRSGIQEVEHTHAFDDFSAPYPSSMAVTFDMIWAKFDEKVGALELSALAALMLFIILGFIDRLIGKRYDLNGFLNRQPPVSDKPQPVWNRQIPGPVLGVIVLLGLIVFSVIGAYVYYPAPEQIFSQMHTVDAELFSATGGKVNKEEAIRRIEQWDLLTRKLQVGVYIRNGHLPEEQAKAAEDLRERLEEMRDFLRDRSVNADEKTEEAKAMVRGNGAVKQAFLHCEKAFGRK